MKKLSAFSLWVLFGVLAWSAPVSTEAASLYIDPGTSTINRGDSVTMAVRLDTDEAAGECINAVDGVIQYSENIEPVDVSIGGSIFSIWVERPTINRETRTITFAGGLPNGYCGRVVGDPRLTNALIEIVFRSPGFTIGGGSAAGDVAKIEFTDESTAYLNDGQGTKASLMTYGSAITLAQKAGATQVNDWKDEIAADTTAPEKFSISLQKDERAFSQKYYIVFNTTDKQTGLDQYQVMEEPLAQFGAFQWGRADAPWLTAQSPYVLKDQSLNSIIRVKAVDKAGNEYIANYIPDDSMRTLSYAQAVVVMVGGISLLAVAAIGYFVFRLIRRKRHLKTTPIIERSKETNNDTNHESE